MPSVGWEDHGELCFEGAREIPSVFLFCFPFERCVAHIECFVYGNYSYAELVENSSLSRESYGTSE